MEHTYTTQTSEGRIILSLKGKDRIKKACLAHVCCLLILCTLSTMEAQVLTATAHSHLVSSPLSGCHLLRACQGVQTYAEVHVLAVVNIDINQPYLLPLLFLPLLLLLKRPM